MINPIDVRKIAQDILLYVWFRQGLLLEEPNRGSKLLPEIPDELMGNLSVSVWIESFRTEFIWDDFFKEHFKRMTSSSQLFANYVAYACYILNESTNVHESFFDILSILSEFSLRCLEGNREKYLNTCVEILSTFFENELSTNFEHQGGWKQFNEYIKEHYDSIPSKSSIGNDKLPVFQFQYFWKALERGNRPDYKKSIYILKKKQQPYFLVNGIVLKNITQEEVESHEKSVLFAKSFVNKQRTIEELFKEFEERSHQVIDLYNPSDGMKCEGEVRNQTKPSQEKGQMEQSFSKVVQQSLVGTSNKGLHQKIDQNISGKMTSQSGQHSSRKVPETRQEMKSQKVHQNLDQESSDRIKRQKQSSCWKFQKHLGGKKIQEKYSPQKVTEPLGGMRNKEVESKYDEEFSDKMKMQEQSSSRKVQKHLCGMRIQEKYSSQKVTEPFNGIKSKEVQKKLDQESSDGMKMQDQYSSKKVTKPFDSMRSKEVEPKYDQESSGGMKMEEKYSSGKAIDLFIGVKSKEVQQILDQESSDGIEIQDKYSSKNVAEPLRDMRSKEKEVEPKYEQESSDGMKMQEQSSSRKVDEPLNVKGKSLNLKKNIGFSVGKKRQGEKWSSRKFRKPSGTNLYRLAYEKLESKEEKGCMVNSRPKKRKVKQYSSQVQPSPGVMQQNREEFKSGQESFDGIKTKGKECSPRKFQEPSTEMQRKEAKTKQDHEFSRDFKMQVQQCPSQIDPKPGWVQNKGAHLGKDQESLVGMKSEVEQDSKRKTEDLQSNEEEIKDHESSDDSNSQVQQCSLRKVPKSGGMQSKGIQQKKDKKSSFGIKSEVEQDPLRQIQEPASKMQSKEVEVKSDEEYSGKVKMQMEHDSLNIDLDSEIVSSKTQIIRKELESKTVIDKESLQDENSDTISLQDLATPVQPLHLKTTKLESVEKLVDGMSLFIVKLFKLIQSLCEKHGVRVPEHLQLNNA